VFVFLCVTVNCKVESRAVSKSPMNSVINPKQVYSHTQSRDSAMETANICVCFPEFLLSIPLVPLVFSL
jgi:hypothetical protein